MQDEVEIEALIESVLISASVMSITVEADGPPTRAGFPIGDTLVAGLR